MYLPAQFQSPDGAHADALMRAHPLASLVSTDDEGFPFVTHLPIHLQDEGVAQGRFTLLGHVARPNPQWRHLQARPRAVITFLGPHAYMSPSVYPDLARVPTWNYLMVQARGTPRLIADPDWLRGQVDALTRQMEEDRPAPWHVADAPENYINAQIRGIVGVEIDITDLRGKWKAGQNKAPADRTGVAKALGPTHPALADAALSTGNS